MQKCLVCGAVFEDDIEVCPVCGVRKENFVPVQEEKEEYHKDTDEKILILGNGAAGVSAAEAARERNSTCSIILVGNEGVLSYNRPMMTKGLNGALNEREIGIHEPEWYEEKNILCLPDKTVEKINWKDKEVFFKDGLCLKYDKCVYALGSECFIPPIAGRDKPEVIAIRRLADARKVAALLKTAESAVVIGGGVLGLEAAWEIYRAGCRVTILEAGPQLMGRQLNDRASALLKEQIESLGISVITGAQTEAILGGDHVEGVRLSGGEELEAGLVIISAGVRANTGIAGEAGIETDRAVVVNERMETSIPDIYACGDCAQYEGVNYAIWPQALEQGKTAGANAVGDRIVYHTVPAALTFQGMDTALFAIGDTGKNQDKDYELREARDEQKKTYEARYYVDGVLTGAVLLGDLSAMAGILQEME